MEWGDAGLKSEHANTSKRRNKDIFNYDIVKVKGLRIEALKINITLNPYTCVHYHKYVDLDLVVSLNLMVTLSTLENKVHMRFSIHRSTQNGFHRHSEHLYKTNTLKITTSILRKVLSKKMK